MNHERDQAEYSLIVPLRRFVKNSLKDDEDPTFIKAATGFADGAFYWEQGVGKYAFRILTTIKQAERDGLSSQDISRASEAAAGIWSHFNRQLNVVVNPAQIFEPLSTEVVETILAHTREPEGSEEKQKESRPILYDIYANAVLDMRNRGFSKTHIENSLQLSSSSAGRILQKLKDNNRLTSTFQELLEEKVLELLKDAKAKGQAITNKDMSTVLSQHYGREITLQTITRVVSRLIKENKVAPRRSKTEAAETDSKVMPLLKAGKGPGEISRILKINRGRTGASIARIRNKGIVERNKPSPGVRDQLKEVLQDAMGNLREGEKINLSKIARDLNVSRERIRQLYNKLKQKGLSLPPKQNRK